MSQAVDDLWTVAGALPHVDADALAAAIEFAVQSSQPLDYRTRLLIRDSLVALQIHWGPVRFTRWLTGSVFREAIERASDPKNFDPDPEIGFPSLTRRVVDVTKPQTLIEFFRTLSRHIRQPTQLIVGGSVALMLSGLLSRQTDDVDVVNEIPAELRAKHDVLEQLVERFGLKLAHFQSHYLPRGWQRRHRSFQVFGELDVRLVDLYDVMLSKLASSRDKDLDDLRAINPQIDRERFKTRVIDAGESF